MAEFEVKSVSSLPKGIKFSGGADLDMISASDIVEKAIGGTPDFAMIFTYLFRRFGAPTMPQDEYKELCRYVLTTPTKNVFLSISPSASNSCNFGFIYQSDTLRKVCFGNYSEIQKWYVRMQKWAKKKYKVNIYGGVLSNLSIYGKPDKQGNCKINKTNAKMFISHINKWLYTAYPQLAGKDVVVPKEQQQEIISEFCKYKETEIKTYEALYQRIEKKPSIKSKGGIKLQKDIVRAITVTAKDLSRPTYIRDCYFNILKNYGGQNDFKKSVEYFDYSEQAQILRNSKTKK